MRTLLALALLAVGCGGGNGNGTPDMAMPPPVDMAPASGDLALLSRCGHRGDVGNSIGVGKFCMSVADCTEGNMKTNICSSLGNALNMDHHDDTYFCTVYPCHQDGGVGECGEKATCECQTPMGPCACTPDYCIGTPPDAGTD